MGTKAYDNFADLITFSRASGGTALRHVGYGEELVTNGTFDTDLTGWSASGWTWEAGAAKHAFTPTDKRLTQSLAIAGKTYLIEYSVVSFVNGGTMYVTCGGTNGTSAIRGNGNYSTVLTAVSDGDVGIVAGGTWQASIDNVSVKEVIFDRASDPLVLFNHPANIPRVEYAADGTRKGLLIEEARTNLVPNEYNRTGAPAWGLGGSVTQAQDQTSITGEDNSAWSYVGTGNPSDALSRGIANISADVWYTESKIVKKTSGSDWLMLDMRFPTTASGRVLCWFNIGTGAKGTSSVSAGTTTAQLLNHDIEDLGNGYYRVWMAVKSTTGTQSGCSIAVVTADGATTPAAGVFSNEFWQLEAGAFPTSSIRTTGATATRSEDQATLTLRPFNAGAGTFVAEFSYTDPSNTKSNYVWGGSSSARVMYNNAGSDAWQVFDGTSTTSFSSVVGDGTSYKLGVSTKEGVSTTAYKDGAQTATTASGALMSSVVASSTIAIGGGSASQRLNGHIKSIAYYPRRLSNAQLQELTA